MTTKPTPYTSSICSDPQSEQPIRCETDTDDLDPIHEAWLQMRRENAEQCGVNASGPV